MKKSHFWRGRSLFNLVLFDLAIVFHVCQAPAQGLTQDPSIRDLPRPGLDVPPRHIGGGTVRLSVDSGIVLDSNIYATNKNEEDDFSLRLQPSADFVLNRADLDLLASMHADVLRHLRFGIESSSQFGGALGLEVRPAANQAVTAKVQFDRLIESRTDPDARAPVFAEPRKINDLSGQFGYRFRAGNVRFDVNGTGRKIDYLDPAERDRDHRSYEGTVRMSWAPRGLTALFVEGFIVRRDFDLATDFSGVDRDAATYGVNIGVSRELTGRLTGSIGAGFFHFNPDDPTLEDYNGLGMGGRLTWRPRVRTSVTLNLFRGDVATVRSGAMGRTDTRVSVHLDQEVRHNLILGATATWSANDYRGAPFAARDTYVGSLEAEYLLAPRWSLFAAATATKRNAMETPTQELTGVTDDFSKVQIHVGIRFRL